MSSSSGLGGNRIIKKSKTKEKERELLDDLLNDLKLEESKEVDEPIEITEAVKEKMKKLMGTYLGLREKLKKVNAIKKELMGQSGMTLKDLETLMKLYGLTELIIGSNKFVLDQTVKKKALKKGEFKEVIACVLNDASLVDQIYKTADETSEEVVVEKLKCLKYKSG